MDVTELLQKVKPFVLGWIEAAGGGAGPFAPSPHELNGAHHTGTLATTQYPDALLRDGSRSLTGNLSVGAGITIDGVDLSAHVVNANAHHAQQHTLVGADHTATGLTVGHVMRASGATTFAWAQLQHSDLGGVSADQHHVGFVGLTGDSGSATPDASDLILLDGGNGVITAASGNTVLISVANGTGLTFSSGLLVLDWSGTPNNVSLAASAAGSSLYAAHVDHRHQLDVGIIPTWTGAHTFNAGATIAAGQNLNFGVDVALTRGGANVLNLASGDAFRSSTFVPGVSGWAIDAGGTAEFANAFIRGELHSTVFVKDLIEAKAGSLVVVQSAGVLTAAVAVPGSGTWSITVNDPPGGGFLFANSDIGTIKAEYSGGVAQVWFTVSSRVDNGDGTQSYTCTWQNGTRSITYPAGAPVLDYGVSGDGGILMTADLNYAPWLSIFTHAGSPWTTLTHHLRLGNLNGLADYSTDKYGIFIGNYAGNSWMAYDPTNGLRIRGNALIDGTVQATAFTNDMGATFFGRSDGSILLGPHSMFSPTTWQSSRELSATIGGAFHQVAGHFPGARALLIEPGNTNYMYDPVCASTTYWGAVESTKSVISDSAAVNGTILQVTANTGLGNWYMYQATASMSLTAGDKYTLSIRVRANTSLTTTVRLYRNWTSLANSSVTLTQSWQTVSITGTVDTTTTDILRAIVDPDAAANGQYIEIDWIQIEKLAFATSLTWGGAGTGYSWAGTAHASTSSRTATTLTFNPQGYIDLSNGTLSFWFQTPCDYNTANLSTTRGLFVWWDLWNTNSLYVGFNSTMTGVSVVAYAGSVSQPTLYGALPSDMKAGDWVHVVVTLITNNVNLYVNGVLSDTETSYTAPTIANTTAYVGFVSAQSCCAIEEFAAFKRVLTADEIAWMYLSGRPLYDGGAQKRPGVFIFDGEFDLRSTQTGARVQIDSDGISGWSSDSTQTFALETDGDFFAGSSLSSPLNTTLAVFAVAQTYSGEAFGAGDVMIGCNITSANVFFDISAGKLSIRNGMTDTMAFLYTGDATFGEVAANKFNLMWDASDGDLLLRQNTTAYFQVDGSASLLKFGSNVSAAATTAIAIFGVDQTYNSESVGSGDLLIGDNSASKANVLWDKSAGQLKFRGGTTVQVYIDTDGAVVAGGGVVKLNADGIQTLVTTDFANARAYKFLDGTTNVGGLESYRDTTGIDAHSVRVMAESVAGDYAYAGVRADAPASLYSEAYLWALCGTHSVKLQLQSNEASGSYRFYLSGGDFILDGATKSMRVEGGLYVGGIATAADAGQVWLNGLMRFMAEISDPAAPSSNQAKVYLRDNGSGKTQLCVRFATGAVQVLATEP